MEDEDTVETSMELQNDDEGTKNNEEEREVKCQSRE